MVSEGSYGIVSAVQINLQSLQLSLGKEKPELFQCVLWGHFPPLPFLREGRVLIRFPNVEPFSKHIQRFMRFLECFFPPWRSKLNSHCRTPPNLPPQARLQPGLGHGSHFSAPNPSREKAVPRGQKPLALTMQRDEGVERMSPYSAPQIINPTLAGEARNRLGES